MQGRTFNALKAKRTKVQGRVLSLSKLKKDFWHKKTFYPLMGSKRVRLSFKRSSLFTKKDLCLCPKSLCVSTLCKKTGR